MGRIVAQLKLVNFNDPAKSLSTSALVDTGAAYFGNFTLIPAVRRAVAVEVNSGRGDAAVGAESD